jgi:hypothetical protein
VAKTSEPAKALELARYSAQYKDEVEAKLNKTRRILEKKQN